jgi:peptidoglycan hydrolase CwlO-like protein
MQISTEMILFIITILGFLGTAFAAATRYGADMQAIKSMNDQQNKELENLQRQHAEDKAKNYEQHKEFYQHKEASTKMEKDIEFIMTTLADIKMILSERRRSGE